MNIRMEYLYRDTGNYKIYGEVVFQNARDMKPEDVESEIRGF